MMAAGPADFTTTPLPTNSPAPITPPNAISSMCRRRRVRLSCLVGAGDPEWDVSSESSFRGWASQCLRWAAAKATPSRRREP